MKNFKGQNFNDIKKCHDCNKPFVDQVFKADNSSISVTDIKKGQQIKWMRPKEIIKNPKFVVDGFDKIDVNQGSTGNCWYNLNLNKLKS